MRSYKATKRYLLTKKWIDADTCKVVSLSIVLLVIFFPVGFLSLPPGKSYEGREYAECKEPTSDPEFCVEFVSVAAPVIERNHTFDRGEKKSQFYNQKAGDFIKNKRSINAQEGAWRATNLIAILTIFQVMIGFLGLWFLLKTLRATAEALLYTKDTLKEARIATYTRGANILPETVEIRIHPEREDAVQVIIHCRNFGETPARNIMINSGIRPSEDSRGMETLPVDIDMRDGPTGVYLGPGQLRGAVQTLDIPMIRAIDERLSDSCLVAAVIRYDTIFEDDPNKAKEIEFYCRVNYQAFRQRDESNRFSVTATGDFASLTPDIRRIFLSANRGGPNDSNDN